MDSGTSALIVSAVSLLVAGLSLGWQVAQWLLSAARAKATLMYGVMGADGGFVGQVARDGQPSDLQEIRQQGIDHPEVLGVRVSNHGRASLLIDGVVARTRGGTVTLTPIDGLVGPSLPYRIEPGANADRYVPIDEARTILAGSRALDEKPTGVFMAARLGTGRVIKTSQTLRMWKDRPHSPSAACSSALSVHLASRLIVANVSIASWWLGSSRGS